MQYFVNFNYNSCNKICFFFLTGSKYFGDCPVEQFIPVYLIVGGTFGVLKNLLSFFSRLKKNDSEQERLIHRSRDSILNCFLIAWFITGTFYFSHFKVLFSKKATFSLCQSVLTFIEYSIFKD